MDSGFVERVRRSDRVWGFRAVTLWHDVTRYSWDLVQPEPWCLSFILVLMTPDLPGCLAVDLGASRRKRKAYRFGPCESRWRRFLHGFGIRP